MTLFGILVGILLLSLIMILHEFGHYWVGKRLGFKIEQFSLFMGPVLFERISKDGVRFNIKAFPIGASVSFAGEYEVVEGQTEQVVDKNDPGLFANRPRWARALVIAAGPFINFLSAFVVFAVLFSFVGVAVPVQGVVQADSHLAITGVEAGDTIYAINGHRIRTQYDLAMADMLQASDQAMTFTYIDQTDGQRKDVAFEPEIVDTRYMLGISYIEENGHYILQSVDERSNNGVPVLVAGDEIVSINGIPFGDDAGIKAQLNTGESLQIDVVRSGEPLTVEMVAVEMDVYRSFGVLMTLSHRFTDALEQAIHTPWSIVKSSVSSLSMMITGQLSATDNLTGPIGIVNMVGDVVTDETQDASMRFAQLALLFSLISVAVGFTNLLPIPPLDGNHLIILGVEGVMRKSLPEKLKAAISYVGFALIIGLAIFVVYLDVARILR